MGKYVLKLVAFLEGVLLVAWAVGEKIVSFRERFLGKGLGEKISSLFWSRANFDGFHYTKIARDGYQYAQQAFFPLYPQLIKFFSRFFKSYIISGLFISHLAFFLLLWFLFKLFKEEGIEESRIKQALFLLVIFPTSFYFLSVYSESLFLFFVILSFYLARKGKFLAAGLVGGLASYTRPVGVFLFPALLVEYYQIASRRKMKDRLLALKERLTHPRRNHFLYLLQTRLPHLKNFFFISLSLWGLGKYMFFLKKTQNDWLYFAHVQPSFGAQRTVNRIILLYQVFWRYLKMVFTVYPKQWLYFNVWFELIISSLFLFLLVWGWYKRKEYKIRNSWLVFATAAYLLPTLTGTFSSMPRYVLVCFPCFLVLSRIMEQLLLSLKDNKKKRALRWGYILISTSILVIVSTAFFCGYWVA